MSTKHPKYEAASELGSAQDITNALRAPGTIVDQMLALQDNGLEVIPIQGGSRKEKPWEYTKEDKRWEKTPGGRFKTAQELQESKNPEKTWHRYGPRTPLEYYATDKALNYIEDRYYGAGVIFQAGLIGIDADTPQEVQTLKDWWTRIELPLTDTDEIPWTVKTPGSATINEQGEPVWEHSGGGHLWIRMPENWADSLPLRAKDRISVGNESALFDIKKGGGYFITAGSMRSEGPYVLSGEVFDATEYPALTAQILEEFTPEIQEVTQYDQSAYNIKTGGDTFERIKAWEDQRSWGSILSDLNWVHNSEPCGIECVTLKHPAADSAISGIAHGDCDQAKVPHSVHFYSTTAINALGLNDRPTVKKYKFVLDNLYAGNTESFYKTEPIEDTSDQFKSRRAKGKKRRPTTAKEYELARLVTIQLNKGKGEE